MSVAIKISEVEGLLAPLPTPFALTVVAISSLSGNINSNIASAQVFSIEIRNTFLCLIPGFHFHKAKALATTSVAIRDNLNRLDTPVSGKSFLQLLLIQLKRDVPYIKFVFHSFSLRNKKLNYISFDIKGLINDILTPTPYPTKSQLRGYEIDTSN